jgi:hypothetical protein
MDKQVWRQMYHLLYSLDKYFISPDDFVEPPFHEDGLNYFDIETKRNLTKGQLWNYYSDIKGRISGYLDILKDNDLLDKPSKCNLSKFDLIMAQHRHVIYNLGIIDVLVLQITNVMPRYVSLNQYL